MEESHNCRVVLSQYECSPGSQARLFQQLSSEVLQQVLSYLDVSDLLHVSQTCQAFRVLATDPIIHARRLKAARPALLSALDARPARGELLARRTPLVSLYPNRPTMYINGAAQAAQIQAYMSLSRLLTSHKLRRAIESRASLRSLSQSGMVDLELEMKGRLSPSLVPATRALKKAQKTDALRRAMRAEDAKSWKTHVEVLEATRGVWRDDDPRVVSAVCPPVKSTIKFWEGKGRGAA
ncbi:hypothetical protein P389DRAFT_177380 [Cystobasidium minutum MCA 4210]|uniref:uncharacterized protein n=1 Tax=Cystobasidium minutum MCA 4210 TaxID=1397322 RepID=UPI0034CDCD4A|eukprot:jgi/Rhomi1/177380/fgenesh1_pg.1_\